MATTRPIPFERFPSGAEVGAPLDEGMLADLLACDDYSFVRRAYWVLLGREPDPGGLANYLDRLRSGTPKLQVLSELAQSPEGLAKGAGISADVIPAPAQASVPLQSTTEIVGTWDQLLACHGRAFIACAYQSLLGRSPDPDGLRLCLAQLCEGMSKVQILDRLRHSAEYKTRTRGQRKRPLVRRLDQEAWKFRLASVPLLGWFIKGALGIDGNSPIEMRLRRIEYLLQSSSRENEIPPELYETDASPAPLDIERKFVPSISATGPIPCDIADAGLQAEAATPIARTLRSLPEPTNWYKETDHG